jgi:hypothetical protein
VYLVGLSNADYFKKITIADGEITEGETYANAGVSHQ